MPRTEITLVTDKGSASANAYLTVDEADALLSAVPFADEWFDLDGEPETKKALLMQASQDIDNLPVGYLPAALDQGLRFPVICDLASDGHVQARKATAHQALFLARHYRAMREREEADVLGASSLSNPVESIGLGQRKPLADMAAPAVATMRPWLDLTVRVRRG